MGKKVMLICCVVIFLIGVVVWIRFQRWGTPQPYLMTDYLGDEVKAEYWSIAFHPIAAKMAFAKGDLGGVERALQQSRDSMQEAMATTWLLQGVLAFQLGDHDSALRAAHEGVKCWPKQVEAAAFKVYCMRAMGLTNDLPNIARWSREHRKEMNDYHRALFDAALASTNRESTASKHFNTGERAFLEWLESLPAHLPEKDGSVREARSGDGGEGQP